MGVINHVSLEANANVQSANTAVNIRHIVYLTNDSANDIVFNFDAETNVAGAFTLKSGETLEEFSGHVGYLYYSASNGASAFRLLGLASVAR